MAPKTRDEWKLVEKLYGDAPRNTKDWLAGITPEPDLGIAALQPFIDAAAASGKIESLLAPRANAPVLLPTYADLWGTTGMKYSHPIVEFYKDQDRSAGFMLYAVKPLAIGLLDVADVDQDGGRKQSAIVTGRRPSASR